MNAKNTENAKNNARTALILLALVLFSAAAWAQQPSLPCTGGWHCYWVAGAYYECDCSCATDAQCWTYDGAQWYCNFDVQQWNG